METVGFFSSLIVFLRVQTNSVLSILTEKTWLGSLLRTQQLRTTVLCMWNCTSSPTYLFVCIWSRLGCAISHSALWFNFNAFSAALLLCPEVHYSLSQIMITTNTMNCFTHPSMQQTYSFLHSHGPTFSSQSQVFDQLVQEAQASSALISKVTNISWPFWHFLFLFHLLNREKTEKVLKGEQLLHCWSISITMLY